MPTGLVSREETCLLVLNFLREEGFSKSLAAFKNEASGILKDVFIPKKGMKTLPSILGEYAAMKKGEKDRQDIVRAAGGEELVQDTLTKLAQVLGDYDAMVRAGKGSRREKRDRALSRGENSEPLEVALRHSTQSVDGGHKATKKAQAKPETFKPHPTSEEANAMTTMDTEGHRVLGEGVHPEGRGVSTFNNSDNQLLTEREQWPRDIVEAGNTDADEAKSDISRLMSPLGRRKRQPKRIRREEAAAEEVVFMRGAAHGNMPLAAAPIQKPDSITQMLGLGEPEWLAGVIVEKIEGSKVLEGGVAVPGEGSEEVAGTGRVDGINDVVMDLFNDPKFMSILQKEPERSAHQPEPHQNVRPPGGVGEQLGSDEGHLAVNENEGIAHCEKEDSKAESSLPNPPPGMDVETFLRKIHRTHTQ